MFDMKSAITSLMAHVFGELSLLGRLAVFFGALLLIWGIPARGPARILMGLGLIFLSIADHLWDIQYPGVDIPGEARYYRKVQLWRRFLAAGFFCVFLVLSCQCRKLPSVSEFLVAAQMGFLVPGHDGESLEETSMSTADVSLGYVILYVDDVAGALAFYEEAFGLTRRFFNDDNGMAYGELETGSTRLAFASLKLANSHLPEEAVVASPDKAPLGVEIALTTSDVPALFDRAVKAGAAVVSEPAEKPWGQIVAYVRDRQGFLVELCSPLP